MKKLFYLLLVIPFIYACSDDDKEDNLHFKIKGGVESQDVITIETPSTATLVTLDVETNLDVWLLMRENKDETFWSFVENPSSLWEDVITGFGNSIVPLYFEPNLGENDRVGHLYLHKKKDVRLKEIRVVQKGYKE